jgi:hypothetical protein
MASKKVDRKVTRSWSTMVPRSLCDAARGTEDVPGSTEPWRNKKPKGKNKGKK